MKPNEPNNPERMGPSPVAFVRPVATHDRPEGTTRTNVSKRDRI